MLLLSKKDIQEVFTMKDAIEANKKAFQLLVNKACELPLRTKIQAPKYDGAFLFMPGYVEEMDTAALKIVNIFPENIDIGLSTAPSQVLLIDGKTGITQALLNGTYLTQLRTGAATGVAFDLLGKSNCKIGALIGTGSQGEKQLEAMLAVRALDQVRVFDIDPLRRETFANKMKKKFENYDTKIIPVKTSDEAIDNADLLITVTPSTQPVFDGTKVKKGATISCVGAYQHHMQEMDPRILPRASKIYFDSQEAVLSESGDITIPLKEGIITEDDFTGNIGDLINGNLIGRENDDEIIIFETVGIAVQDLITAKSIYDKAVKENIGTHWNA